MAQTIQDTEADIKYMETIGTSPILDSGCYLTRKQAYRGIRSQLQAVEDNFNNSDNSIVNELYLPAIANIKSLLLRADVFTTELFEKARALIHLCNSTTSYFEQHGEESPVGNNDFYFGYLYSIIETLIEYEEWGYADEETSTS